jgi:hypothetical protein
MLPKQTGSGNAPSSRIGLQPVTPSRLTETPRKWGSDSELPPPFPAAGDPPV